MVRVVMVERDGGVAGEKPAGGLGLDFDKFQVSRWILCPLVGGGRERCVPSYILLLRPGEVIGS